MPAINLTPVLTPVAPAYSTALSPSDKFSADAMRMILSPEDYGQEFDMSAALALWYQLEERAAFFKDWEMQFRKECFKRAFPAPKSGVNTFALGDGYVLKGVPKVNIRIDKELFPTVRAELAAQNFALDDFLKIKYELNEANYKAACENPDTKDTVAPIVRKMITTSEGAPTLEIALPKKRG